MKLYNEISYYELINHNIKNGCLNNVEYIKIGGIGESDRYLSFTPELMVVGNRKIENPRLAVAWKNLGEYELILHRDFVGGGV
jgi:hypothetical protein